MNVATINRAPDSGEPQRKKPLRTYSKKRPFSAAEHPQAPMTEKRRKTSPTTEPAPAEPVPTATPDLPRLPVPPPSSSFEKGSILNYFKPCRSSSSADSSVLKKLASSSPTLPLDLNPPRAPRRLQLRPPTSLLTNLGDGEESDSDISLRRTTARVSPGQKGTGPLSSGSFDITKDEHLQDAPCSKLNQMSKPDPTCPDPSKPLKKPTRTKSAPIQTTINLSTKPTFEECKICQIVYNPLHPPDVKFHTKRHKVVLRSLTRS